MLEHTKQPDLVALSAGLEDFNYRLGETRQRSQVLEARMAAFHLRYVRAGAPRTMKAAVARDARLFPFPASR